MNATRTDIDFDVSPFFRSHGQAPRGRGSWAFSFEANPRDVLKDVVFTPGSMTYADARLWMRAWVRAQQASGAVPMVDVTVYAQP